MLSRNRKISILDCTLRDGGYVNDFKFGFESAQRISSGLSDGGIDIVELGFLKDEPYQKDRTIFSNIDQAEALIPSDRGLAEYCVMIRPDWVDIEKLTSSELIGSIRFAFHPKDLEHTVMQANYAIDLGYSVFLNPVNITSYADDEIILILRRISDVKASGISIVDTFGSMQELDLYRLTSLFHRELNESVPIGLHLHENLASSFLLAQKFLEILPPGRDCIIDTSILGLGRIPGNLQTEQMVQFLNSRHGANYNLMSVLKLAYDEILPLKKFFSWGYSPEYAVSASLGVHRSYAEYAVSTRGLSFDIACELMASVAFSGKGKTFDEAYFQSLIDSRFTLET
jgi:4-hydroxy 2-oxovalerate aldolase